MGPAISIRALGPVACDALVWRVKGNLRVTVAVKATFDLVHRAEARLQSPLDVTRRDVSFDRDPSQSLERASDLVPLRMHADVTFVGHAHAAGGRPVPAMAVRLALFRERALVDKTLQVFGDRREPASQPAPFVRMPIRYERGAGIGHARPPNVIDARDPRRAAGFGPERRLAPAIDDGGPQGRSAESITVLELPEQVDWNVFSSAPVDQRAPYLHGDEWIVLDGLHPTLPRLETRLPSARGVARVTVDGHANDLELQADTLAIDGDAGVCSVVWRGRFAVADAAVLARLTIVADVETSRRRVTLSSSSGVEEPLAVDLDATAALTPEQQAKLGSASVVPFSPEARPHPAYAAPSPEQPQQRPPPRLRSTASLSIGEQGRAGHAPATPFDPPRREELPPRADDLGAARARRATPPTPTESDLARSCPPRTAPTIPVFNKTEFSLVTLPWQVSPPQESLTVFVKGTFPTS